MHMHMCANCSKKTPNKYLRDDCVKEAEDNGFMSK